MPATFGGGGAVDVTDDPTRELGKVDSRDASPPLVALSHIGTDVDPDEDAVIAPASGRVKVEVGLHPEADGRLWIGVGQAAQPGVGNYYAPGFMWTEFSAEEIHVYVEGASTPQRVVGMEWAA